MGDDDGDVEGRKVRQPAKSKRNSVRPCTNPSRASEEPPRGHGVEDIGMDIKERYKHKHKAQSIIQLPPLQHLLDNILRLPLLRLLIPRHSTHPLCFVTKLLQRAFEVDAGEG